ncbi:FRG domain-containing protein [Providencia sp. PROV116]|uniref:FRG domain-containing protein n=1 Tax=Providencia sp. PROV116 TaxID=2949827 RepID=UPI00234BA1AD|nr:FRG domain-containing protein [Providencia sp. PROV116]ELR5132247.1 FRG domain-containing protein [Providencia rettgeri]
MSDVISIQKLSTFIGNISDIEKRSDHTLFFRGHADAEYQAQPSIFRGIPDSDTAAKYIDKESQLFHDMIMRCPEDFINCSSAFDFLVKMQHYGLPTRLLDITSNPLVALYFACCSLFGTGKSGKTGEVLIYQIPDKDIKFYDSDTVSVISNLSKLPSDFDINKVNDRKRYLHMIKAEKAYFEDLIVEGDVHRVLCVKPKLDNKRIIRQSGAFLLFGMGTGTGYQKNTPAKIPEEFHSVSINRINITASFKLKIIEELKNVAISEATLFPEIDNVARFLKA